jgi:hypothetical protein
MRAPTGNRLQPAAARVGERQVAELPSPAMAVSVRKLSVGDVVEIDGQRYEVVPTRDGELTLESPITPMSELHAAGGTEPASADDFQRLSGHLPHDDEG